MPRLLDLFCGAGGAAMGYHRAGFDEIVGVDIKLQPRYPFEFVQADAMTFPLEGFDAIHASPPCQGYTLMNNLHPGTREAHPRLIEPVRQRLQAAGVAYAIENVVGAPLLNPTRLCGSSFGLGVRRHRLFESNWLLMGSACIHALHPDHAGVYGHHPNVGGRVWSRADGHKPLRRASSLEDASERMGINWMTWREIVEAIPPAYTQFIGEQLLSVMARA